MMNRIPYEAALARRDDRLREAETRRQAACAHPSSSKQPRWGVRHVASRRGRGEATIRALSSARSFADLAIASDPRMDLLALAIAQEFRDVDPGRALAALDALGEELARSAAESDGGPEADARACGELLGGRHNFEGDRQTYDDPDNSMLDLVLATRRGLPILLSVVYIEVARRADIPIGGVGLPGHFVVAHFGARPPLLLDPFDRGRIIGAGVGQEVRQPWRAHDIAMRMLNNLVGSFQRRANLTAAIRAASMRLELPAEPGLKTALEAELRALQARLN
jgi:regulator of sirC expression with transglutaminase-like and TPR domain